MWPYEPTPLCFPPWVALSLTHTTPPPTPPLPHPLGPLVTWKRVVVCGDRFLRTMCMHGIHSIAAVAHVVLNVDEHSLHPAMGIVCSMLFLTAQAHVAGGVTRLEYAALPAVQGRSTACLLAVMMNTSGSGTAGSSRVPWLRSAALHHPILSCWDAVAMTVMMLASNQGHCL